MGAGQVVRAGDAGAARRLLLTAHHLRALRTQLQARVRVYRIVYAFVARREASQHPAVGGVDDGVASEGRDVPAPDAHTVPECEGVDVDDTLPLSRIPQVRVLHREDIILRAHGRAHVHQRTEQPPSPFGIHGDIDAGTNVLREPLYEEGLRLPPFIIVHIIGEWRTALYLTQLPVGDYLTTRFLVDTNTPRRIMAIDRNGRGVKDNEDREWRSDHHGLRWHPCPRLQY